MKRTHKLLSILLCCAMLLGILPMTAMATEATEIEELSFSFMSPSEIPAVGTPIKNRTNGRLQEDDDRISLTGIDLIWNIDNSSVIVNPSDLDTGMCFEAGRSYNAEFIVQVLDPNQYTITENTVIKLTDQVDFTYTSSLSEIVKTANSFYAHIKLTITMNGERTYPDIDKVVFKDFASPADGMAKSACGTDIYYSNCQMISGTWLSDVWGDGDTFVAGETYTYRVALTAREGYKFDENATVILTNGVPKEPSHKQFTNDNRELTLDYTYTISGITSVDRVEATIKRYEQNLTPIAGECAVSLFTDTLEVDEDAPYEVIGELGRAWYSEDGTMLTSEDRFEAGKTYYFDYVYSIKTEYKDQYRFVADGLTTTITGESYTGAGFQKAERVETNNFDNTYVQFRYYFTAQFPAGAGSSAGNPAFCYSYEAFKYAMEVPNIRYVALGNVEDTLPLVSMEETGAYADNRWPGIWVNSNKNLNLLGNAQFTAPNATENVYRVYDHLIQVRSGSRLAISGSGSLTFHGNAVGWTTSVVEVVNGGVLTINSGTVKGDTGNRTSFCYGINVNGGTLYVNDGTVIGTNRHDQAPISAVNLYNGTAYINGGTFYSDVSDGAAGSKHYGLYINEGGTYYLSGGAFEGVIMPYASTMSDYVAAGYTMTVNGVNTAPANCGTTSGYVEIFKEISAVDIHVNSPVAGESPAMYSGDIYLVPEGVTANDLVWYENGQPWNLNSGSERFEAGSTYTVEITLVADEGVKFADPLNSATINYETAEVSAFGGNAENGITLTVDLGACPNVVPQVDLTVTAPKEGNTPSYTIGCGSDAYYPVGGSNNYTEYRQWYMSSDNDDWWEINGNHTFLAGYYYKLYVDIRTNEGYEFPLIDVGTIQPDVTATVNGYSANVIKAYEQDPSRYITVEYNFGECNDDVVENIAITNIDAPVAGQTPDYMANCFGTGYSMAGTNSGNWKVNGIVWLRDGNIYTGSIMDNTEKFQAGHEYTVMIDLVADSGYTFLFNHGNSIYAAATINGNTAQRNIENCSANQYQIWYTFTCGKQEIDTITLSGLDAPVGGNVPDTAVTAAYPEYYTVQSVTWTDIEGGAVGATFETGVPYQATIVVEATAQADFTADPAVYIDGSQPNSNNVTVNGNTVTIVYTFSKPASAPEAPAGTTVSGTVKAYNSGSAPVVKLYADGVEKYTAQIGAASASGNQYTWSFTFADVAMGYYDLVVTKAGHLTYTIEDVLVTGQALDLTAHANAAISTMSMLAGNMNGDTAINNSDLIVFRAQFGKTGNNITNPLANINGDSAVNNSDLIIFRSSFGKTTASCTIAY